MSTSASVNRSRPAAASLGARLMRRLRLQREGVLHNEGGRNEGPPDLDELWRDFNRKLSSLFGGKGGRSGGDEPGGGAPFQPEIRHAGWGVLLVVAVIALVWLGSGFFVVQEGQQAVVTTFGRYSYTADAGWHWRLPYPFQGDEVVAVTQLRTKEIGGNSVVQATGLRDSSMLTEDENIVDIRFTVQYRLKDAREYLYNNANLDDSVVEQAAESAVREIVGRSTVDSVLYEQRDAIATDLVKLIQAQLDRLKAGILVVNVNVQSVQVPEQVQAAFNDAFKAGADRDRLKNEGQAYASDVIPKAQGTASRLRAEAEAYKARVVDQAQGDAERFRSVLAEYQKAPAVTRDRLYIDTMREVLGNVSKVYVDSRNNSNLLYLPLDKLLQQGNVTQVISPPAPVGSTDTSSSGSSSGSSDSSVDLRTRDPQRARDRDGR
jgi:membrane protease subunit HflK